MTAIGGSTGDPPWRKDLFSLDTPETAIATCRVFVSDFRISMSTEYESQPDKVAARETFQQKFDAAVKSALYGALENDVVKEDFARVYATKDEGEVVQRCATIRTSLRSAIRTGWDGDPELQKTSEENEKRNNQEGNQMLEESPQARLAVELSVYLIRLQNELLRKLRK